MRVAVIGGTGNLGAPLVERLLAEGDEVRVLSRGSRPAPRGADQVRVDLHIEDDLPGALAGCEVVVDAANEARKPRRTFVEGTSRVLAAAREAGARHYLAASVVGCDRVPLDYYRQKVAQEDLITSGPVPWTLIRATQFHTLVAGIFASAARYGARPTGRAKLQPVDVEIVAERLAAAAHGDPAGRLPAICGPEVATLGELSLIWRRASGSRALPVRVPSIGGIGRALADGALCDADGVKAGPSFGEWLKDE